MSNDNPFILEAYKQYTQAIKKTLELGGLWPLEFSRVEDTYFRIVNDQIVQWFRYKGEAYDNNAMEQTKPQAGFFPLCSKPDKVIFDRNIYHDLIADVYKCSMEDVLLTPVCEDNVYENLRRQHRAFENYVHQYIRPIFKRINTLENYFQYIAENGLLSEIDDFDLGDLYTLYCHNNQRNAAELLAEADARKYKSMTYFSIMGVKNIAEPNYKGEWSKYDFPYTKVTYPVFRELTKDEIKEIETLKAISGREYFNYPPDCRPPDVLFELIAKDLDTDIQSVDIIYLSLYNLIMYWLSKIMVDKNGLPIEFDDNTRNGRKNNNNCEIISEIFGIGYSPGGENKYRKLIKFKYYLSFMGYNFNDKQNYIRLLYSILNHLGMYRPKSISPL